MAYFKLSLKISALDNLDTNSGGYFKLSFVMETLGNLNAPLGFILKYFL